MSGQSWWHAFECPYPHGKTGIVLDVRTDESAQPQVKCPKCDQPMRYCGFWLADENGYGSRADPARWNRKEYDGSGEAFVDQVRDFIDFAQGLPEAERKGLVGDLLDRLCLGCGVELPKYGPCPRCGEVRPNERDNTPEEGV